jgi:hypothetical protein
MPIIHALRSTKVAQRVTAVLDLFRGIPVPQITAQFGICRSDLYKFRLGHSPLSIKPWRIIHAARCGPITDLPATQNNESSHCVSATLPGAPIESINAADLLLPVHGPFNG